MDALDCSKWRNIITDGKGNSLTWNQPTPVVAKRVCCCSVAFSTVSNGSQNLVHIMILRPLPPPPECSVGKIYVQKIKEQDHMARKLKFVLSHDVT